MPTINKPDLPAKTQGICALPDGDFAIMAMDSTKEFLLQLAPFFPPGAENIKGLAIIRVPRAIIAKIQKAMSRGEKKQWRHRAKWFSPVWPVRPSEKSQGMWELPDGDFAVMSVDNRKGLLPLLPSGTEIAEGHVVIKLAREAFAEPTLEEALRPSWIKGIKNLLPDRSYLNPW